MWNCVLAGMAQTKQVVRVGHAFVKEPCIAVAASYPTRARCAVCLSHQPRVRVRFTSSLYPERKQCPLVLEQEALEVQPATETGQRSVGADHAMARQDERQRVLAVRRADRARRIRAESEPARLLAVAHGLAVGDRRECEPALPL